MKKLWFDNWHLEEFPYKKSVGCGKLIINLPNIAGRKKLTIHFPKYREDELKALYDILICCFYQIETNFSQNAIVNFDKPKNIKKISVERTLTKKELKEVKKILLKGNVKYLFF